MRVQSYPPSVLTTLPGVWGLSGSAGPAGQGAIRTDVVPRPNHKLADRGTSAPRQNFDDRTEATAGTSAQGQPGPSRRPRPRRHRHDPVTILDEPQADLGRAVAAYRELNRALTTPSVLNVDAVGSALFASPSRRRP